MQERSSYETSYTAELTNSPLPLSLLQQKKGKILLREPNMIMNEEQAVATVI